MAALHVQPLWLTIAAVHLSPWVTVPFGVAIALGLLYYGWRLGRPAVPPTRRMIRRWSVAVMILACVDLVVALSFADRNTRPEFYVAVWFGVLVLMFIVILIAMVDVFNSLRLQRQDFEHEAKRAAGELSRILKSRPSNFTRNDSDQEHSSDGTRDL